MQTTKSVLICGNYGYRTGQIDGQTVKTRVLRQAFAETLGDDHARVLDTSYLTVNPLHFVNEARRGIKECSQIVMLPGDRSLKLILPLFLYWARKWERPLWYVVIGGWLPDLLARKRWLRYLCSRLSGIYVETPTMASRLSRLGLPQVQVLPNFRKFDRTLQRDLTPPTRPLKLVFYSRVIKEKGIEEAIAAVTRLNQAVPNNPAATLDVYGPTPIYYRTEFERLLSQSPDVHYRGVLSSDNVHGVLQHYDLMLFPTYYEGEGFPGAIVDAFIAGVPVLASDWKYNREIIDEGKTGVIHAARSVNEMVCKLRDFVNYPNEIMPMRQHCIREANKFHVHQVVHHILQDMSGEQPVQLKCTKVSFQDVDGSEPAAAGGESASLHLAGNSID
jgi:glycosyltransferase involved in cell wall biosynthesis